MTDSLPLVSIVTPSFNQAPFLRATIESVLTQDYPRIEYFVNDGGSTDGSAEIIREYENRLAAWVSERDGGQSDAVNKGWKRATGEIVAWINSDDTYLPGAVHTAVEYLLAHPEADLVYSDCPLIDATDKRIGTLRAEPFALQTFLFSNYIPQSTVFIRRAVLERIGLLNPELHYGMDYDYWMRTAMHFQLAAIPGELATYRWHGKGKFITRPDANMNEYIATLQRAFEDAAFPRALLPQKARALGACYLHWGLYCFTADKNDLGVSSVEHAFQQDPSMRTEHELIRDMLAYHIVNVLPSHGQMDEHSKYDLDAWVNNVYANWAPDARSVLPSRNDLAAQVALIQGFGAFRENDVRRAGRQLWQAVRRHPGYLSNRGVISILWKAAKQQVRSR